PGVPRGGGGAPAEGADRGGPPGRGRRRVLARGRRAAAAVARPPLAGAGPRLGRLVGRAARAGRGAALGLLGGRRDPRGAVPRLRLAPQLRARLRRVRRAAGPPVVVLRPAPGGGLPAVERPAAGGGLVRGPAGPLARRRGGPLRPGLAGGRPGAALLRPLQA